MATSKPQSPKQVADSDARRAKRVVRCPSCNGDSLYSDANPHRPFCSARCKNLDFGAWAAEAFRVSATPEPDESEVGGSTLQ